jgi:hypothetical protein
LDDVGLRASDWEIGCSGRRSIVAPSIEFAGESVNRPKFAVVEAMDRQSFAFFPTADSGDVAS